MRSRSKIKGCILVENRKFILGALLSVVLYGLAGTKGFELANAEIDSRGVMGCDSDASDGLLLV